MNQALHDKIQKTAGALRARLKSKHKPAAGPEREGADMIGLILGSGLGVVADRVTDAVSIPFQEIEGFPQSTVVGHAGRLVAGKLAGKDVIALSGRAHLYEGKTALEVTFPVRVLRALGVDTLLVTNAAGGIRPDLRTGHFMLISDHLNLQGANPLQGPNDERLGPRFPDMTTAYDAGIRKQAMEVGKRLKLPVSEGVYAAMPGPTYETPAEIRMLRAMGADAVGMSTVPEVIVARHGGMKVVGISFIANAAAGLGGQTLTHEEVTAEAAKARPQFEKLVTELLAAL